MGQLTGERLGEAVGSADVFCSPSITETFGQVTLQGMAAGLPVVGVYAEGTADLVRHWDGGVDVSDGKGGRKGRRGCGLLLDPLVRYPSSATASSSHASTSTSTSAVEDTTKPRSRGRFGIEYPRDGRDVRCGQEGRKRHPDSRLGDEPRPADHPWTTRVRGSKWFTWEGCSQRMVDVYAEVVAEGAQASSSMAAGASTSMTAGKTKAETQTPRRIFSGKRKNGKKALGDVEAQIVGGGVRGEVGDGGGDDKVQREEEEEEEEEEGDGGGESPSSPTFPTPASTIAALGANVREWTTYLLDVVVVVHAVVGATLSHAAFMVPTGDDLAGLMWGSRRRRS
ncbi:hypothetical protein R3P38DRAFT_2772224 [Favolaschia claudopus]|uniref:Glycosyl transferase family 1 domain-containing protein n=1 Tax=Favolaschia claudopus TaxID=2862362 RepID=A0AAW0C423_9AGAR